MLVARTDGSTESGFAPGAIKPRTAIPVTRDFDDYTIGLCDIAVEGTNVFATITEGVLLAMNGLYPALGGRSLRKNGEIIEDFDILVLSLCNHPNVDPQIPPL